MPSSSAATDILFALESFRQWVAPQATSWVEVSTRNLLRVIRRDGEEVFWGGGGFVYQKTKAAVGGPNKHQTNNVALADFISFISYVLIK